MGFVVRTCTPSLSISTIWITPDFTVPARTVEDVVAVRGDRERKRAISQSINHWSHDLSICSDTVKSQWAQPVTMCTGNRQRIQRVKHENTANRKMWSLSLEMQWRSPTQTFSNLLHSRFLVLSAHLHGAVVFAVLVEGAHYDSVYHHCPIFVYVHWFDPYDYDYRP